MTSEDLEDEYPHWKDALFGNHNAVANIRCAIHYVFWHSVYALIAIIGGLLIGAIKVGTLVAPIFGPLGEPIVRGLKRAQNGLSTVANHEYTEMVAIGALAIAFVAGILFMVGALLYFLYTQFWMTIGIIAGSAIGLAALFGVALLVEYLSDPAKNAASSVAMKASAAGQRAVETPGIRRVYGQCPVSIDQAPKWFENLFPEEDV